LRAIAGLLAIDVVLAVLGAGILLGSGAWDRLSPLSRIGPAVLLGMAGATAGLGALVFLDVSPTPAVTVLLAGACLAGGLALRPRVRPPRDRGGGGLIAAAVIAVICTPFALRTLDAPLVKFDAYSDWSLKARLLAGHGGTFFGALDSRMFGLPYMFAHREYPVGLPALEALGFHAAGTTSAVAVHGQFLVLGASFLATAWTLLRPRVDPWLLGACLLLLVVAPGLHDQLIAGYADVPLGCFWATGALALCLWILGDGRDRLVMSAVLLAAAAATKQEGVLFDGALILTAVIGVLVLREGRRRLPAAGALVAFVVVMALPWQVYVRSHGLHDADISPGLGRMADQVHAVPTIVRKVGADLVWTRWPGIVPLAVLAAVLLVARRRLRLPLVFLAILATACAGLVAVYWNARVGINGLLGQSAERVVVTPILFSALVLPLLLTWLRAGPGGAEDDSAAGRGAGVAPDQPAGSAPGGPRVSVP
jgi:hypothetical protein